MRPDLGMFLSYDRSRPELAALLAETLTDAGFDVWFDPWRLVPGERPDARIDQALAETAIVALCVGPGGLTARQEHELARASTILPVLLPGAEVQMLSPELAFGAVVVLSDGLGPTAVRRLLAALAVLQRGGPATEEAVGDLLQDAGDPEGAAECYRRALARIEARCGPDDPALTPVLARLAVTEALLAHHADAERLARRALAIDRRAHGPSSAAVARDLNALGYVFLACGDGDAAAEVLEDALAIDADSDAVANNLAAARYQQGDLAAATEALRGVSSAAINTLGAIRRKLGDLHGARVAFERALESGPRALDPRAATTLNNLGVVLGELGDLEQSRSVLTHAIEIDEAAFGTAHPATAVDQSNVALTLSRLAERVAAREAMTQAHGTLTSALGPRHAATRRVRANLDALAVTAPDGRGLERRVAAAAFGDSRAWERLVREFTPRLRAVARLHGLSEADVDDVLQETWAQAFRHIGGSGDARAFGAWLETIARRESLRSRQRGARENPTPEPEFEPVAPSLEAEVLANERAAALRQAVDRLPPDHRQFLHALLEEPAPSYSDIASRLGVPVGTIGPIRARSISRLRRDGRLAELLGGPAAAS